MDELQGRSAWMTEPYLQGEEGYCAYGTMKDEDVNRVSRGGATIGKEQAVTVYEALEAVTINATYQYGEEASKGSIRVGKRADLVILDKKPLQVPEVEIKDIQVLETIKDGMTIYKK